LSVALLVPPPVADEVDGLRRAFGSDVDYIVPHLTLVPPVNLADEHVPEALATLRRAAAEVDGPLRLELGPLDTFLPRNAVLFHAVGGPDLRALGELRRRCLVGPFDRPERRSYVPHVTVVRGLAPDEDSTIRRLLGRAIRPIEIERLHLLVQVVDERGRRWVPTADARFEPRRMVGTGGLGLEVAVTELADPEVRRFLAANECRWSLPQEPWRSVVATVRHDGAVVGVAAARQAGLAGVLDTVVVEPATRRMGIGIQLVAAVEHDLARHGAAVVEAAWVGDAPGTALLAGRGWTERPGPGGVRTWRALGPGDPVWPADSGS
jgi:2'-5' RNA ligase